MKGSPTLAEAGFSLEPGAGLMVVAPLTVSMAASDAAVAKSPRKMVLADGASTNSAEEAKRRIGERWNSIIKIAVGTWS